MNVLLFTLHLKYFKETNNKSFVHRFQFFFSSLVCDNLPIILNIPWFRQNRIFMHALIQNLNLRQILSKIQI